jgi:cytochrome c553
MKLFHQLRGTSKQKGIKEYAFTDKPVDLAELKGFVAWYRRTYPNISLPQAPDKIASRVEEFRQSVQKRNPVSPMQPVAPYSDIPELSDEDMQNIEAMIEAARKKSRGQAA